MEQEDAMSDDRFLRMLRKQNGIKKAETEGLVADSLDVRMAILQRIHSGAITLEEGQGELKKIKRGAHKKGLLTRTEAWRKS
jgi:hypothetical protein